MHKLKKGTLKKLSQLAFLSKDETRPNMCQTLNFTLLEDEVEVMGTDGFMGFKLTMNDELLVNFIESIISKGKDSISLVFYKFNCKKSEEGDVIVLSEFANYEINYRDFPKLRECFPEKEKRESVESIGIGLPVLETVVKLLKVLKIKNTEAIFNGQLAPISLRSRNLHGEVIFMPSKL